MKGTYYPKVYSPSIRPPTLEPIIIAVLPTKMIEPHLPVKVLRLGLAMDILEDILA